MTAVVLLHTSLVLFPPCIHTNSRVLDRAHSQSLALVARLTPFGFTQTVKHHDTTMRLRLVVLALLVAGALAHAAHDHGHHGHDHGEDHDPTEKIPGVVDIS